MRKVLTFLAASLVLGCSIPVLAQATDPFKDVPTDHWAYQAVESLRAKNIVIGYPDGYFRGKRTLTRYEFAVALDRALKSIPEPRVGETGPAGPAGPAGPQGEAGPQGPPGVTPEELANFRRLAEEFRNELTNMGNTVAGINRKLDALAKEVADLRAQVNAMPKWYGGAFVGVRSDRKAGSYVDRDGIYMNSGSSNSFVKSPAVVHQLELGVLANIPGGATLDAAVTSNTYKNYLGGNTAVEIGRVMDPPSDTYVHHLEINAPFSGIGRGSKVTVGRYGQKVSRFTLWKPEVDSYFDNPFEKDGNVYMDGARLSTNFGSVSTELWAGKTSSVTGSTVGYMGGYNSRGYYYGYGSGWNSPVAGVGSLNLFGDGKPYGMFDSNGNFQPALLIDEMAGLSLGLNVKQLQGGHVRFTAIAADGTDIGYTYDGPGNITNVLVLGADADLKLADRLNLTADWGKTILGRGRFDTVNAHDNNAFNATLGYGSGALNLQAGYRYIDPLFYAPGYWGRIGNWLNPTNIQGPIVRANFDLTPSFTIKAGGDFFTGAKNRAAQGGLTTKDDINRVLLGMDWGISKGLKAMVDWEGVYYSMSPGSALGNTTRVHPTEHYINLGAGYNLTSNTILKLGYQIGSYDGHGAMGVDGLNRYNFNSFTTQVAVKF